MSEGSEHDSVEPVNADRTAQLWRRLKDHRIAQWAVGYIALAYALQHGVVLTTESMDWPHGIERVSMILLALGLPVAIALAWYHGGAVNRRVSGGELSIISLLLVIGAFLFYTFAQPSEHASATANARQAGVTAAHNAAGDPRTAISVVVLPFANMSGDPGQEFFSDGMTEEITTALAKIPDLRVVARESAFQFKGEHKDLRAVGQTLGATHLIEGSVRKVGDRVRITAQLINADDGTHIWAESYDREAKDVFAVQEEIARAITTSLRMPLGLKPGENLVNNRGIDPDSYAQYLRAKALYANRNSSMGTQPLAEAADLLEQVLARNPSYAPAWARLALVYGARPNADPTFLNGTVAEFRAVVDEYFQKGEAAAQKAIRLDSGNADAYAALAQMQSVAGKFIRAEDLFKQALMLDPNNPDALLRYSDQLAALGQLKEALALIQRLRSLDPLVSTNAGRHSALLWLNGDTDGAIALAKTRLTGGAGTINLAEMYASVGRYGEAADMLAKTDLGIVPDRQSEAAARIMRTAPAKAASPQALPSLSYLNFVFFYVGAAERVLEPYERDVDAGFQTFFAQEHLWHPVYAPMRKTERFKTFLRKSGRVDYWKARGWPDLCRPVGADDFACN